MQIFSYASALYASQAQRYSLRSVFFYGQCPAAEENWLGRQQRPLSTNPQTSSTTKHEQSCLVVAY
jgi:hypothetical protein